jgi:quercetin dioxygenase-like cupin family protein
MSEDAVRVAPESYKVLFENNDVRVLDVQLKKGGNSEMHSHPKSVVYCLNDSKAKFTFPGGKSDNVDLKAGQTVWLDAVSHSVENTGPDEMRAVIVELKK